jgi:threonine/homoserine/homoserine lactone efflux protein
MPSLSPELLPALVVFALVASITPGPNNTMLMASGVNFGVRATAPHMAGVCAGFFVLVIAAGLVLGGVFAAFPTLHGVLKVVGAAYLLYLAWKIARSGEIKAERRRSPRPSGRPPRFSGSIPRPGPWCWAR